MSVGKISSQFHWPLSSPAYSLPLCCCWSECDSMVNFWPIHLCTRIYFPGGTQLVGAWGARSTVIKAKSIPYSSQCTLQYMFQRDVHTQFSMRILLGGWELIRILGHMDFRSAGKNNLKQEPRTEIGLLKREAYLSRS